MSDGYEAGRAIGNALSSNTDRLVPILERIAASLEPLAAQARTERVTRLVSLRRIILGIRRHEINNPNEKQGAEARRHRIADILAAWPELADEVEP